MRNRIVRAWSVVAAAAAALAVFLSASAGCALVAHGRATAGGSASTASTAVRVPKAAPLVTESNGAPRLRYSDWRVPVGWWLLGACDRWAVLCDATGSSGSERIMLLDPKKGTPKTILSAPVGSARNMSVTGAQVSEGWIVWDETSQYDIELGSAARWSVYAAPLDRNGRVGRIRSVDQGVVGTRPRVWYALAGGRLLIGSTTVDRSRRPVSGSLAITDLATGRRSTVATMPATGIGAVAWSGGRLAAVIGPKGGGEWIAMIDETTGATRAKWPLGPGISGYGRPALLGEYVVMPTLTNTDYQLSQLRAFDASGAPLWRTAAGSLQPYGAGRLFFYVARDLRARPAPVTSVVMCDPRARRTSTLAKASMDTDGEWMLATGGTQRAAHVWAFLDRTGPARESGRLSVLRCYDVP